MGVGRRAQRSTTDGRHLKKFIDGSFCTKKPDAGDVDGYWVEPDHSGYDRIDLCWIGFAMVLIRKFGMEVADVAVTA
jgi:hypothetical protein